MVCYHKLTEMYPCRSNRSSQAEMTVVTALFMIPTAMAFPAMMRSANTPPSSDTLALVRKHKTSKQLRPFEDHDHYMDHHDQLVKTHHEDFQATVSRGELERDEIPSRGCLLTILNFFQSQPTRFFAHLRTSPLACEQALAASFRLVCRGTFCFRSTTTPLAVGASGS